MLPLFGRNAYSCCLFFSLLRRRIFFLRHFHLCLPRFFQALELRFIRQSPCPCSRVRLKGFIRLIHGLNGLRKAIGQLFRFLKSRYI